MAVLNSDGGFGAFAWMLRGTAEGVFLRGGGVSQRIFLFLFLFLPFGLESEVSFREEEYE